MNEDKFIPVFLHEGQRYTQAQLVQMLKTDEEDGVRVLKRLKEYGVLKTVKNQDDDIDLSELTEEHVELAEVRAGDISRYYKSCFVGVILVENWLLKCYPKYMQDLPNEKDPTYNSEVQKTTDHLKQVLEVLKKYNRNNEQIIYMQNETNHESTFNLLAVMLYLLQDYYDYGLYTNTQEIIESNGNGEILWDKTINETFTLISNNRPYYPELLTRKRVTNDYDYFRRLHACVLTECSALLKDSDLDKLFGIDTVDLSTESREDFGDDEYIMHRIMMELNVQYNTHKQLLLKTLYAYIAHGGVQSQETGFSMYGTNSFHAVWENVCAEILGNQLEKPIKLLGLQNMHIPSRYDENQKLVDLIEKPKWYGYKDKTLLDTFCREAKHTLKPDIVRIDYHNGKPYFMIYDAKYYNITLKQDLLNKQPGIESITKQYLYQLAYEDFTRAVGITEKRNCFLLPTAETEVGYLGFVALGMLDRLGLNQIEVRQLPAETVYKAYLQGKILKIDDKNFDLDLYDTCEVARPSMLPIPSGGSSSMHVAAISENLENLELNDFKNLSFPF